MRKFAALLVGAVLLFVFGSMTVYARPAPPPPTKNTGTPAVTTPGPTKIGGATSTPIRTPTDVPIPTDTQIPTDTVSPPTNTPEPPTATPTDIVPTETNTLVPTSTPTATRTPTLPPTSTPTNRPNTPTPTNTAVVTPPPSGGTPYPNAPLCPDVGTAHELDVFHTLWDSARGCHYDHEHGENPFTSEVEVTFPGFDLFSLLGDVEIGHTNPSSDMENTMKHGGFKWQVDTNAPHGCEIGFEGGVVAVDAYAIQDHNFGRQDIEFESRVHSGAALLRQCKPGNPSDKGYVFVIQFQEYGQRVTPYQGSIIPYPNTPLPAYDSARGPYFTTSCVGTGFPNCLDFSQIVSSGRNTNSIWTSKPTGSGPRPPTSTLFRLLFRIRDNYQVFDSGDLLYPFTWRFVCGDIVFNPIGCRHNSSTSTIHEVAGTIPAAWDGLVGWDTDSRSGRVSADGFVTRYGQRNPACTEPSVAMDCFPIKLVSAFVGFYSSELSAEKVSNPTPSNTFERDVYFCNGLPCSETDFGAIPSGWIGPNN